MAPFQFHIFVCCNRREAGHPRGGCEQEGEGGRIRDLLKRELAARGLAGQVRANQAGCLDQCEYGPTVVIYPPAIWYGNVTAEDVPRIVQQTLLEGVVLEDLQIPPDALNSKGRVAWRRAPAAE